MKRILLTAITAMALVSTTWADDGVQLTVRVNQPGAKINKEIYGQFAEHLGSCIYGVCGLARTHPFLTLTDIGKTCSMH